jgi:hypothetical protein
MRRLSLFLFAVFSFLLLISGSASVRQNTSRTSSSVNRAENPNKSGSPSTPAPAFKKAFVLDDRLSALRRKPDLQGEVIRRLRLGHAVYIVGTSKLLGGNPRFCRVAVSRRTRGWIHESALAVPGRAGEDQRILTLIEATEGTDRIILCRLLSQSFSHSRLLPRTMLLLGEEAERIAGTLGQRTRRRLAEVRGAVADPRDYYLSDAGLDRYSKLGVVFDFNESTAEFVYDGKAYRDLVKRFPKSEEAALARERLQAISKKGSSQHRD